MATFLVECYWVGVVEADVTRAMQRLRRDGRSERRQEVMPLASFLIPMEEVVFVFVDAASASSAMRASSDAGMPVDRVSRAIEVGRGSK